MQTKFDLEFRQRAAIPGWLIVFFVLGCVLGGVGFVFATGGPRIVISQQAAGEQVVVAGVEGEAITLDFTGTRGTIGVTINGAPVEVEGHRVQWTISDATAAEWKKQGERIVKADVTNAGPIWGSEKHSVSIKVQRRKCTVKVVYTEPDGSVSNKNAGVVYPQDFQGAWWSAEFMGRIVWFPAATAVDCNFIPRQDYSSSACERETKVQVEKVGSENYRLQISNPKLAAVKVAGQELTKKTKDATGRMWWVGEVSTSGKQVDVDGAYEDDRGDSADVWCGKITLPQTEKYYAVIPKSVEGNGAKKCTTPDTKKVVECAPSFLLDMDLQTAWCETGIGETVQLKIQLGASAKILGIDILNGYHKNDNVLKSNGYIRSIVFGAQTFDDLKKKEKLGSWDRLLLKNPFSGDTFSLDLEYVEGTGGDACMSEIRVLTDPKDP